MVCRPDSTAQGSENLRARNKYLLALSIDSISGKPWARNVARADAKVASRSMSVTGYGSLGVKLVILIPIVQNVYRGLLQVPSFY